MLALWMFGTELERIWGTQVLRALLLRHGHRRRRHDDRRVAAAVAETARMFDTVTIGASGAIYGLLLAYGLTFPNRPIYVYFVFPIPAKYFVMIMGAHRAAFRDGRQRRRHRAHHAPGRPRRRLRAAARPAHLSPANEVRYRYLRWKMDRARKKFGVYSGGRREDWDKHVH